MKTKNEKQRLKSLTESLSYASENGFSEVVVQTLQHQLNEVIQIVEQDKAKRKAFNQAIQS